MQLKKIVEAVYFSGEEASIAGKNGGKVNWD